MGRSMLLYDVVVHLNKMYKATSTKGLTFRVRYVDLEAAN